MSTLRLIVVAMLATLFTILAIQNAAVVQVEVFSWSFETRRFVVIGFSLLVGLVIGWIFGRFGGARRAASRGKAKGVSAGSSEL